LVALGPPSVAGVEVCAAQPHQFKQGGLNQTTLAPEEVRKHVSRPLQQFGAARQQSKHLSVAKAFLGKVEDPVDHRIGRRTWRQGLNTRWHSSSL
jgi:hypothetical protein